MIDAAANTSFGSITYGTYTVMAGIYDQVNVDLFLNETSQGQDAYAAAITASGDDLLIGATDPSPVSQFLDGDIAEVITIGRNVNAAERIIIDNYLSAKYNIALAANDVYEQDDAGDFDFEVAGIGQAADGTFNKDGQGTSLVRMNLANDLDNDEFLMWGHDGTALSVINSSDVDGTIIEARLERVWRVSENDNTGTAVDVGTVRLTFDVQSVVESFIVGSDLRLLITRDDAIFIDNDVTPQAGSYNIDNQLITFSNVSFQDGDYFTLGTADNTTSPLPIELISFDVATQSSSVIVKWRTATELNNDFFTVEKSVLAEHWEVVVQTPGAGTTTQTNQYQITDNNPYPGISYYRLKQTDYDGHFSYSNIAFVYIESDNAVNVYPNPVDDVVFIESDMDSASKIYLMNSIGQVMNLSPAGNENSQTEFDTSGLSEGIYFIVIENSGRRSSTSIIISH
ncbi:MAG: T9SS type A sorting domain-containing protein [Bacteroidetes bacterium]|nr:T9SS type A sorting domain-containing protein [Bacteroidota bacterium]MDA1120083.1 T9SS type A sorting domain-containing protein [Bacteroidota bacterium]